MTWATVGTVAVSLIGSLGSSLLKGGGGEGEAPQPLPLPNQAPPPQAPTGMTGDKHLSAYMPPVKLTDEDQT